MIYLKYFETDAQYDSFLNSEDFIEPNVSFVGQSTKKHYNPRKLDINPTVSIDGWTYGDTSNDPTVSGNLGDGSVTYYYRLQSTSNWSTTKPTNAGIYDIRADIAETKRYHSGTCSSTFTISKASRTISFETAPASIKLEETATISATPSDGVGDGTITYSSSDPTIASVNGNVVSGVSTGSCTITATISQGDNYLSASTSYTLNIFEDIVVNCVYHVEAGGSGSGSGSGGDLTIKLLNTVDGIESIRVNGTEVELSTDCTVTESGDYYVEFYLSENEINDNAFSSCYKLISCTIGNGVTSIGSAAFNNCSGMTSCTIGSGVTSIGDSVFEGCRSLESIDIPNSVTSIGNYTFAGCTSLTSCTIGSGVTSIGWYAFNGCSSLTNITCNTTTAPTIQSNTFQYIESGGTLYVPSGSDYSTWMDASSYYLGYYSWTKVEQ